MVGYLTPLSIHGVCGRLFLALLIDLIYWHFLGEIRVHLQMTSFVCVCMCACTRVHTHTRMLCIWRPELTLSSLIPFSLICVFVFLVCVHEHTYRDQRKMLSDCRVTLCLIPLRQSLLITEAPDFSLCPSLVLGVQRNAQPSCLSLCVCWRFEVRPHALGCWAIPLASYPTLSCWPCDQRASFPPLSRSSEGMTSILRDLALLWNGSSVDKISFSWLWIYIFLNLQQEAAARKELVNRFAFETRKERTHATHSHLAPRHSKFSLLHPWVNIEFGGFFLTYSSNHSQYYNTLYIYT